MKESEPSRQGSNESFLNWIRNRRKAELHLHLLGCLRWETARELASQRGRPLPATSRKDWIASFTTGSLQSFVENFIALFDLIQDGAELERVALEAFEDLHHDGVEYAEPRVTVTSHLSRGLKWEEIREALDRARDQAQSQWNLEIGWIVDFPSVLGPEAGGRALRIASEGRSHGVVGFDVAGFEGTYREIAWLKEIFREAHDQGLGTTAHVGESGPAENVRVAVEEWEVDRIGHGISAVRDTSLMDLLAERKIPIEINATSNLALGNVASLSDHPLEIFRRKGIPIVLNTDDPALLGITLSEEVCRVATEFDWNRHVTEEVLQAGWRYAFRNKRESGD